MTYNEFMRAFDNFLDKKADEAVKKYGSVKNLAAAKNMAYSSVKRAVSGACSDRATWLSSILGEDLKEEDIDV